MAREIKSKGIKSAGAPSQCGMCGKVLKNQRAIDIHFGMMHMRHWGKRNHVIPEAGK